MGIFDLLANVVSLPLDVVSDVSNAVQGKKPENTKEKIRDIGEDIFG